MLIEFIPQLVCTDAAYVVDTPLDPNPAGPVAAAGASLATARTRNRSPTRLTGVNERLPAV